MKAPPIAHLDPADAAMVLSRWREVVDAEQRVELGKETLKEDKAALKKRTQAFRELMKDIGQPSMFAAGEVPNG